MPQLLRAVFVRGKHWVHSQKFKYQLHGLHGMGGCCRTHQLQQAHTPVVTRKCTEMRVSQSDHDSRQAPPKLLQAALKPKLIPQTCKDSMRGGGVDERVRG